MLIVLRITASTEGFHIKLGFCFLGWDGMGRGEGGGGDVANVVVP